MYMYTGVKRENVIADTTGRWNLIIGAERGNAKIEARQMKTGRPWSAWAGTNVTERFDGVRFMHNNTTNYLMTIQSGGHHQITWAYPHLAFNDRNIWMNSYAPGAQWYEVRIKGDVTSITVSELGTWVVLLDFYSPRKNNTCICKT